MNFLYIHSHDTGRFIQPYGHLVKTPHMQKFAEESVLFRNAHCVTPTCSPSRAALLTGTYPHENGMNGLAHRGWALKDYSQHLLHRFKEMGHTAVLSGTQHIATEKGAQAKGFKDAAEKIGYDLCLGGEEHAHTQAIEWLEKNKDTPFFMSVGFHETHREFPEKDALTVHPDYVAVPSCLPDTAEVRADYAAYLTMAETLDQKIGAVLEALDRLALSQNTIVIITTDHGIAFPRYKCNLQDTGTGVMLMMRTPKAEWAQPQVVDAQVSHLDIYPTLQELFGFEVDHPLRGKSLVPLLKGESKQLHQALFTEVSFHASEQPIRAIRTPQWKYIRRYGNYRNTVLPNCDNGPSKTVWQKANWGQHTLPEEALFDLTFDPMEMSNLAKDEAYREVLEGLRSQLNEHLERTSDPLLNLKHVPGPSQASLNPVEEQDTYLPKVNPTIIES